MPKRFAASRRSSARWPICSSTAEWEPHVPTLQSGVYASRFPGGIGTLWLLVNRTDKTISGDQLEVPAAGRILDLWHGVAFPNASGNAKKQRLNFEIEAHGYGAVLSLDGDKADKQLFRLMATMNGLSKKHLSDFSAEWKPLPQKMVEIAKTKPAAERRKA